VISLIQFMHNGQEHKPDNFIEKKWNKGDHGRKFLKTSGIYIDEKKKETRGEIAFWGEWEPESRVVRRIEKPVENGPHYVYEPYFIRPTSYKGLQNTDPFVFGDAFRYSFCLQPRYSSLRNLEKGSVILFGSRIQHKFALDTMFVVSDSISYSRQNYRGVMEETKEIYKIVTLNPILDWIGSSCRRACSQKANSVTYKLYTGANFNSRIHGMFSFFPCQIYTQNSIGFARPTIQISAISDNMSRGIKKTEFADPNTIKNCWNEVVAQVGEKCFLGIFAELPRSMSS